MRNKGNFKFAANLEVKVASPLDPRVVVDTREDLYKIETWPNDGNVAYLYGGIIVACADDNSVWLLTDEENYQSEDSWTRIDIGALDLSIYATKEEFNELNTKINSVSGRVKTLEDSLRGGDGDETNESVFDKINKAVDKIESVQDKIDTLETMTDDISQLMTDVNVIKANYMTYEEMNSISQIFTEALESEFMIHDDDTSNDEIF